MEHRDLNTTLALEEKLTRWLHNDDERMHALRTAAKLDLPQWCLAAGFVRNLIWDTLHGFEYASALEDIDLIYYDAGVISEERDRDFEHVLRSMSNHPWSVKNQARMHKKIGVKPYHSVVDAMSYWPEVETAIGAKINHRQEIEIISPFALPLLVNTTVTINSKHPELNTAKNRAADKGWFKKWPKLVFKD
ncbi:nitrate reductase [Veronia nyctiphanis]|uniref:Nitrate reductase n=2 Tax=Veronia nyctiphanis TaxID=1278244 RepID=A0A4Q0YT02_9GAMM|nr:nitrate reductase [Veronia nyctiphanis]